ncbi:MCE family protein [Alcaligenaceae bacterium LF4-65]|uniref:MCE family protein n=1 Tax=Zwartia hollandica TaxID=324606 RepID=A0A953T2B2_9BURK|nr:MlaD family protein [Zwartia hollandica]MBZ1350195.1 MCE family protein [Zwartia hollandica]
MENRSHALLAGLFTLLLVIAGAVGAVWVSKKNVPLLPYELVASSPVTGLSVQSAVRYQGVPVGRVQSLRFMPDKPGQVRILIGIDPNTPLTESSWAEIVTAGVTGISNVELRDDGKSKKRLVSSVDNIHDIPIRPSFLERLQAQSDEVLPALDRIMDQIEKITSDQNIDSLQTTMKNVAELSTQLNQSAKLLEPGLKKLPAMVDGVTAMTRRMDDGIVLLTRRLDGAMADISILTRSAQEAIAKVNATTLPDVSLLSSSVVDASRTLTRTVRQFGQSPQSFIFGPPRVAPGPGEPGFAGFGSTAP